MKTTLSVVIPCYNETATLEHCVDRVRAIASDRLALEIVIVNDASTDDSLAKAHALAERHPEIRVHSHEVNQGKGAALRTGFQHVTGDFVAVQDADLEYDPRDLVRLIEPLEDGRADVVLGSRFLSGGAHRVLYFWHSMGNRFLTLLSNVFTDLNLTDMETCYKVFKREIIQSIEIEENRFGFEPEIVAKLADRRLRIYEMGISYDGRTYDEGKKIGVSDGFRALYCILRYNAHSAPVGMQFMVYLLVGGVAALSNLLVFALLHALAAPLWLSVAVAFAVAAWVNYLLCLTFLFRSRERWGTAGERRAYVGVVAAVGVLDFLITRTLVAGALAPLAAKALSTLLLPALNFAGRRFLVFEAGRRGPWKATARE